MNPRMFWQLYEPLHAITYFAPESHAAYEDAGLRGFWRGYFAGRAAPLGPVGAGTVAATFFGFHPSFVARAIPSVWDLITPSAAIEARLAGIDRAVTARFDSDTPFAEAADIARRAVDGCPLAGRPLFAANAELAWPSEPHLVLWHACTLLREHRGDGHVSSLVVAGLDGCEAHVLRIAADREPLDSIKPYRGWTDDDWTSAAERLRGRGLVATDWTITAAGRELREHVEDDTDQLASGPLEALSADEVSAFTAAMRSIVDRLIADELIPYPNPIGVTPPN